MCLYILYFRLGQVTDAVLLMSKDFDIIVEQKIQPSSSQTECAFVNVGWGSTETQFKGSIGKNANSQKNTVNTLTQT